MSTDHLRYRPEIDGLRAIAILSVLFYHAHFGFPGGFVGVDVFFVISGYLITSLIFRDMQAGQFSIVEFWERRVRRIMPALAAVVIFTLLASLFILLPLDLKDLGKSAVAQGTFTANIFFMKTGDYFAGPAEDMTLLHTWSLAVEEQFYFIFPVFLLVVHRFPLLRSRHALMAVCGVVFLASFSVSIVGVSLQPIKTFFLLPTRAWELLAGSLLAFSPIHWVPVSRIFREIFSWLGLSLILFCIFSYSEEIPFPGLAAFPPCLGAVLVIWATGRRSAQQQFSPTSLGRFLALKPVVFIGLISYSLYLWHWPIFSLGNYWIFERPLLAPQLLFIGLAFLMAILSYRYVETPFRRRLVCGSRWAIFGFTATCLASVCVVGSIFSFYQGFPRRFPSEVVEMLNLQQEKSRTNCKTADILAEKLYPFGIEDSSAPIDMLVWGDSHARQAVPAFDIYAKKHGLAGRMIAYGATTPLFDYASTGAKSVADYSAWSEATLTFVKKHSVKKVILISRWMRDYDNLPEEKLKALVLSTISKFNQAGAKVYVLMQIPDEKYSVPKLLAAEKLWHLNITPMLNTPGNYRHVHKIFYQLAAENSNPMAVYMDPSGYFLSSDGTHFVVSDGDKPILMDTSHITFSASKKYLGELLENNISP